ncbi:MAG: hemolysin family protein [Anaerolineaceae bacterium]
MHSTGLEFFIIILLVCINGFFALSEMAIVSARKVRLEQRAEDGNKGAIQALKVLENPSRFLSTVQVFITLIGILSGAFGGVTLANALQRTLDKIPALVPYSQELSVAVVVIFITFLSLVFGELFPKQIALMNAERLAITLAPVMHVLSIITRPVVLLLSGTTNLFLKLFRIKPSPEPGVTVEDVRSMISDGTKEGVFESSEQEMVNRVFKLDDRTISSLMTPRTEVVFIDIQQPWDEIRASLVEHPYARFPVYEGQLDSVLGVLDVRDVMVKLAQGQQVVVREILRPVIFLPETISALDTLDYMRENATDMAIIMDEFSGVLGLVTRSDVLEVMLGHAITSNTDEVPEVMQRADGSWLVDGLYVAEDLKTLLDVDELPEEAEVRYETLGGLILAMLERLPVVGDVFTWNGYRFEVVDMDGRRIDKVLISRVEE